MHVLIVEDEMEVADLLGPLRKAASAADIRGALSDRAPNAA
jgi:hypothetical protein